MFFILSYPEKMQENNKDNRISILSERAEAKISQKVKHEKESHAKRNSYQNQAFALMWQLLFIIGTPALLAVIIGKRIDENQGTDKTWTLILLGIALVITWIMIIRKYQKYNDTVKKVEKDIENDKENLDK